MQDPVWVAAHTAELLEVGQVPLMKFEILVGVDWIDLKNIVNNAIVDGGFEEWLTATNLEFWTETIQPGGGSTINREAVIVHGGTYCLRIDVDAVKSWVTVAQDFSMIAGADYELTFWYRGSEDAGTLIHFGIVDSGNNRWLDDDGTWRTMPSYEGGFTVDHTTTWTKFTLNFTAHAVYTDYVLTIINCVHGAGVASCEIYVDDIVIAAVGGAEGNYVESVSISLGGAGKTPDPVAGSWSAVISNEAGLFHPQSGGPYADYITTGRKVRISIGATYDDGDHYWQRIIGYMDEPRFNAPEYKIDISGGDYMKLLRDKELRELEHDWGGNEVYASIPSDGLGVELYDEDDALTYISAPGGEDNDVVGWTPVECDFDSIARVVPVAESDYIGNFTNPVPDAGPVYAWKMFPVTAGTTYRVKFQHRVPGGYDRPVGLRFFIRQDLDWNWLSKHTYLDLTDEWQEEEFYFTAITNTDVELQIRADPGEPDMRVDMISICTYTPYWEQYYPLLDDVPLEKGPYHVTYDGDPVWENEIDEGWGYAEVAEPGPDPPFHPAGIVFFDPNKEILSGKVVVIYYYLQQTPEDIVQDLCTKAGIVDALVTIPTGLTIDQVWFKAGTTCLEAIRMVCEVSDYRFYFAFDGVPNFIPKPAGAVVFDFADPKNIASAITYQDRNEIRNRVVIEGIKRAHPVSEEQTTPSELRHEVNNAASIAAYGEITLTIKNHLFQDQDDLEDMCDTLLDEYKEPEWYSNIVVPFNPVPLELGDKIEWEERLNPTTDITQMGWIRDIKITNFTTTYICELDT